MPADSIKNKNRNNTADLLKGLAVVFMVQVHIMELFARQEIYDSAIGKVSLFLGGPPCAPIFMGVMGFFLFSRNKTFLNYLKRGLILFFGGILLNIGLNAHLLLNGLQGKIDIDPLIYIFGVDILPLAGLSVILIAVLRLLFKEKYILYFAVAILIALSAPFIPVFAESGSSVSFLNAFLWGHFDWSYFPVFPWFAYVITGYAFRIVFDKYKLPEKFTVSHSIVFSLPFIIAIIFTISYAASVAHNLNGADGYYHHGILYFAWIMLFACAYIMLIHIIEEYSAKNFIIRFLKWTGRNVTLFYIFQWLIIGNIATEIYKTQDKVILIFWFTGILIVTSIFVFIYNILKNRFIIKQI
jgi:uncharacterized membrane protein